MSHTNYTPNLGELCNSDARRDAVHIAVAPVVAGCSLDPGDHVYLDFSKLAYKDNEAMGRRTNYTIGVVDPFLETIILKGHTFWLFLYPGTITGLRHVWTHPAFATKVPTSKEQP